MEYAEAKEDSAHAERAKSKLNTMVAVTVALLATFLGVCKVKDDNIVQAMQQSQAKSVSAWSTFHAKSTEAKLFQVSISQLRLAAETAPEPAKARALQDLSEFEKKLKEEGEEKQQWQEEAKKNDALYDKLNYRDDQFDLADTLSAIAISMLAVTALTGKRWMYFCALVPTGLAVLMGAAGLFGLSIHPDAITNLLSTCWLSLRDLW